MAFWVMVAGLVAFSGFRHDTGTDFPLYETLLEQLDPTQAWWPQMVASPQDPGFTLLSLICLSISSDVQLVMIVSAVLTVTPMCLALRYSSKTLWFSMLLYVLLAGYLFPMNLVRQGIAVALNFYAWRYLDSHRERFLLINAVASLFHLSALVAAALQYVLRNIRPGRMFYTTVAVIAAAGIAILALPVDSLLAGNDSRYLEYLETARKNALDIGVGTIATIVFRLGTLVYTGSARSNTGEHRRFQVFATATLPFLCVGVFVSAVARMELYFASALLILLPRVAVSRQPRMLHITGIVMAASVYFVATLLSFYDLLPYQIWVPSPTDPWFAGW
ncbi:EpsG family protein [Microbacterium sp. XT11]|uniref:EpsG family protein n=1 Tax=Microbacterium sp. XT11 TaxID=367477 RepID=UPI001E2C57E5|nr:EpsG family protein [Microbacterium sp. XT11]